MQFLLFVVAFVGGGDTGGGGDGRNLPSCGAIFQHYDWQNVERIDAIDWADEAKARRAARLK